MSCSLRQEKSTVTKMQLRDHDNQVVVLTEDQSSGDRDVLLYDVRSGNAIGALGAGLRVTDFSCHPNKPLIAWADGTEYVSVLDVRNMTGKRMGIFENGAIERVSYSKDGSYIFGTIDDYDSERSKEFRHRLLRLDCGTGELSYFSVPEEFGSGATVVLHSPHEDSSVLLGTEGVDNFVHIVDTDTANVRRLKHANSVFRAAFNPADPNQVVTCQQVCGQQWSAREEVLRVWDLKNNKCRRKLPIPGDAKDVGI